MARMLKDWITSYMQYSYYSEAPEPFHFWTAVSVIGAALRRKTYIDQFHYQWSPNFYIIFVAKPGIVTKSTTINIGTKLLEETKAVKFGPHSVTWQTIPVILKDASEHYLMPDSTFFPMSCLTFNLSELGTFLRLDDAAFIDFLVDMWDGKIGVWQKATKMSGCEDIVNPWMNIIAATTPDWLSTNLTKSMLGGGFVSRCIFIFGEKKRHRIAYPAEMIDLKWSKEYHDFLVHDLEEISRLAGEFKLEKDAIEFGQAWYETHCDRMEGSDNEFGGYLARKQCSVHKLAMVLSASASDDMIITKRHLESAIKFHDGIEADYPAIFQKMHTTVTSEKTDRIVAYVKQHSQGVPKMQLFQIFFHHFDGFQQFDNALTSAIQAGYVAIEVRSGTPVIVPRVGRQSQSASQSSGSVIV